MIEASSICARVAGFDPAEFWELAPERARWEAMVGKYELLARVARLPEDQRKPSLREAASRWPGSLREAELIGPARVDARSSAARAGLAEPERSRASWIGSEPAIAVICWAILHGLLEDQLRFRSIAAGEAGDSLAFSRWIAEQGREAWPTPERIPEVVGPKLRVRSAYLWLAARAGLALPSLNALLLARAGHWDRRPDDPPWAHADVV